MGFWVVHALRRRFQYSLYIESRRNRTPLTRENSLFIPELGVAEKIHNPTFTTCQNIHSLIKNLKFMPEIRVNKKNTYLNSYCMTKHTLTNQKFEIYGRSLEVNANPNLYYSIRFTL